MGTFVVIYLLIAGGDLVRCPYAIAGKAYPGGRGIYVEAWIDGWNKLNAKRGYSWESNPWVWVIEFKKL